AVSPSLADTRHLTPTHWFHDRTDPRTHPPAPHRRRDARVVPRLLDERDRAARAPRRARWAQARAPPHLVRHARAGARARALLQEERHSRRRRARQVSPARRCGGVRLAGADGPGILAPQSAGGWAVEHPPCRMQSTDRLPE